jgi:hypothetical protein
MPRGLEVIAGFATNPSTTLTTVTMSTGQSAVVRGTDASKASWLLSLWGFCATAGAIRLTSPRLHDQVQGLRWQQPAASVLPRYPGPINAGFAQRLYAQDNLTLQVSGGGSEIDCVAALIGYEDLAGIQARLIDVPTLRAKGINAVTAEVTVTAGTAGSFAGGVAINSTFDTLIANTDYAILGGISNTRGCVVRVAGVDFGNLGVGFPAEPLMQDRTMNFFEQLAYAYSGAWIPVFNSANKAGTTIDVQTGASGGTYIIDLMLVQLAPGAVAGYSAPTQSGVQPN